jgi:hypothetical protein
MDKSIEIISVLQNKQFIGLLDGLTVYLPFTLFTRRFDTVLHVISRGWLLWTKFFPGPSIRTITGGKVGWLTIRSEIHLLSAGKVHIPAVLFLTILSGYLLM